MLNRTIKVFSYFVVFAVFMGNVSSVGAKGSYNADEVKQATEKRAGIKRYLFAGGALAIAGIGAWYLLCKGATVKVYETLDKALEIIVKKGDITKEEADVIVNAANEELAHGGGVCGAIFSAAGAERLRAECAKVPVVGVVDGKDVRCPVGQAHTTAGCGLPAKHVVHAVGPRWQGGAHGEPRQLADAYESTLACAQRVGAKTIVFPVISGGIFGYPKKEAAEVACESMVAKAKAHGLERVTFALLGGDADEYFRYFTEILGNDARVRVK